MYVLQSIKIGSKHSAPSLGMYVIASSYTHLTGFMAGFTFTRPISFTNR